MTDFLCPGAQKGNVVVTRCTKGEWREEKKMQGLVQFNQQKITMSTKFR